MGRERKKSLLKCERRLVKLPKGAIIIYPFLLSSHFHNHIHTRTQAAFAPLITYIDPSLNKKFSWKKFYKLKSHTMHYYCRY